MEISNNTNKYALNKLGTAVINGDLKRIKELMKDGYDIHYNNEEPLLLAILNGRLPVVKFLIENNANINETLLVTAVLFNYFDIVKHLVEQGVDIHMNDDEALKVACRKNYKNIIDYITSLS